MRVAVLGDLASGGLREVFVAGRSVTLANVEGTWHAFYSTCPHAGGPLVEGTLRGNILTCPYHGWSFDVRDGSCQVNPEKRLQLLPVQVLGDGVHVGVAPEKSG